MVLFQDRNALGAFLRHPIGKKYLFFFAIMVIGAPFALYSRLALDFTIFKYTVNILFFGLFLIHVQTYARMRSMVFILICALCFYGLSSLISGVFQEGRFTFGTMYDPNDLAYIMVSLVPFTALYLRSNEKNSLRLLAAFTMAVSMLVILSTGSRGGLLGLMIFMYFIMFSKLSPVGRSMKLVLLIGILIFAVSKSDLIFTERYATIFNLRLDYNVSDEEGRLNLWKKGIELTLTNPLTGVGAACFPEAIGMDRRQRNVPEKWQDVHNAFIQISSELGLIAFIIFVLLVKNTFQIFRKVRYGHGDRMVRADLQILAGIAQIGFISHLFVAFFLTQGYSIVFTFFFALAAAMDRIFTRIRRGTMAEAVIETSTETAPLQATIAS